MRIQHKQQEGLIHLCRALEDYITELVVCKQSLHIFTIEEIEMKTDVIDLTELIQYEQEMFIWESLSNAGQYIDKYGMLNFLNMVGVYINNPEQEDKLNKIVQLIKEQVD